MDRILKYDDLVKISNTLSEIGYNCDNLTIEIGIRTQKMLDRINADFFYKVNNDVDQKKLENVSEVNVRLNGVKFRYVHQDIDEEENG